MKDCSSSYYFNVDHACNYGVDESIILQNLMFWIKKNKANNKHHFDGRTWTYNSIRAFTILFPFWSQRQIERILKSLLDKEVIVKGTYNKMGYDKTLWYALKDEEEFLEPLLPDISPNGGIDSTKRGNGFHQTVEPIPYNKPYNKPDELRQHSFKDSPCYNKQYYLAEINKPEFKVKNIDFEYYWDAMEGYSEQGNKYKNWLSTAKTWIRRDIAENKVKTLKQSIRRASL